MGVLSCWSCQSPVAHSYKLLNQSNSFCGGMFKLNTKFDADSLFYSVILNVMAPQYTCSLHGIHHPHWLVQWSLHCSHMSIPVHSSLADRLHQCRTNCSCYINNGWTFFLDKPCVCMCVYKISTVYHSHYAVKLATNVSTLPHSYNHTMMHKVQIYFPNKHKLSSFPFRNTCAHFTLHPAESSISCGCWGIGVRDWWPAISNATADSHQPQSCCTSTCLLIGVAVPLCYLTVPLHSPLFRSRGGKQK